ncbi:MAG: ABC transporter substrate-binding protein, partial [Promethearchaeota archaeon]
MKHKVKLIERKTIFKKILGLSIILILILPINILNFTNEFDKQTKEVRSFNEIELKSSNSGDELFKLVIGTGGFTSEDSYNLDPQNAWDSNSFNLINQVCEGLFKHNLSDPDYGIVPQLAEDYGTWNDNNYTISLKTGITFHDGTSFNATAVKFTFDRLTYLINNSMAAAGSLYEYYDLDLGMNVPIINKTEIVNENTVKFVLNKPYGIFETLLCFPASYILSPTSTPPTEVINDTIGDLIGTGPFDYDHIIINKEVKLHAFENYWAGKANITVLQFLVIPDAQDRNDALLSGEIDLLLDPLVSMIPIFEADPNIEAANTGQGTVSSYLSMNNNKINVTWRQAISYAIDYSHIIEELTNDYTVRLKSPIPESILFANWSFDVATLNITKAREFMQIMGFGGSWDTSYPGGNEGEWASASFATFNYTYNIGSPVREGILSILQNNLSKVGIVVIDDGIDQNDFRNMIYDPESWDSFELVFIGWGADFNDPSNFINNLFTNRTVASNFAQYNGYDAAIKGGRDPFDLWDNVQLLMEEALFETDQNLRESYYDRIQEILVEKDMPWAYMYIGQNFVAYRNHILGFQPIIFPYVSFYGVSQNSSLAPQTIYIDGNAEWQYFKDLGRCTGQGTVSEPYIIRDLVINGQNNSVSCIRIENSDVYFVIENCTLFNSRGVGIELNNVTNAQLIENTCSDNNFGISLDLNSISTEISGNFIFNNSQYGIILNNAQNNLIFNNKLILNNINAYDSGTNNNWDNGAIGNYWSDYGGVDMDEDGIGDTPHTIPGPAGRQDNFPIYKGYITPGIVEYLPSDELIKIGVINDMNHMSGQNTWKGAYLAAKEINEAGGVLINSSTFYIGLVSQNTFEYEEPLDIQKAVDAVNNLISIHDPDFIIGSTRHEAGAAYLEPIMDAKIPFLGTGNTLENLTQNVLIDHNRYKYFFRLLINGSRVVTELLTFQIYLTSYLDAVLSRPINKIAFFYEELYKFPEIVDVLKNLLPSYGIETVKEITYTSSTSKTEFDQYWNEIDNAGAQLTLVGSFFSHNAKLLSESYGDVKPRCLVFNTYLNGTTNTYWTQTNEGCEYEISYQALYNISRTSRSKPFWNNFVNEYNHEPVFQSQSAYNAIYLITNATKDSQSLISHKIVDSLEKINTGNTFPGVAGKIAFISSHDLYTGLGYGSGLMCQWQSGGTKVVIPNGNLIYLDSLATGSLQPPDWGVNIRFTINSPIENNNFTEISPSFNLEILDPVDKMWYTFNTDPTKHFFPTTTGSIDQTAWTALSDGVNRINFYANDSSGDTYRRYVNIIKDTLPPNVTVVSTGSDDDTFGNEPPTIFLNISDTSGITESYYSLDGGHTRIPFTGNVVTINQTLWDMLGEGIVTITFIIIDAVGVCEHDKTDSRPMERQRNV